MTAAKKLKEIFEKVADQKQSFVGYSALDTESLTHS